MASFFGRCIWRPVPQCFRQLLSLTLFWSLVCLLLFYVGHLQGPGMRYLVSNTGRELLQQELDYELTTAPSVQFEVNVDKTPTLNEKDLLKRLTRNSNLPLAYWVEAKTKPNPKDSCAKFPSLYELDFDNVYWQRMASSNGTFYLYGAYWDERPKAGRIPLVRILGMVDRIKPPTVFCQFWYEDKQEGRQHTFSLVKYTYMWYSKWGNYKDGFLQPFVMTCLAPPEFNANFSRIPASVSLVEKRCQKPTNNLKVVNNNMRKKQDFAVCVKGLDFLYEDISVRLIEWLELLSILGAKKVFLYELEVHPNVSKVLSYYQKQGLVELTPLTLPGNQPNLPGFRHLYLKSKLVNKRQNELIPYNDCLYRNLYAYDYLALLDTDEIIMPLVHDDWGSLMKEVVELALADKNYTRASYNFRNVYFLDDLKDGQEMSHQIHEEGIPRYLHMLQHVYRSINFTKPGSYVKCFHNTDRVVSLHNHFPLNCFGQCTTYSVNTSLAQMQHYRKDCVDPLKKQCGNFRNHTIKDTAIWKYKDQLIRQTTKALSDLGFFEKPKS